MKIRKKLFTVKVTFNDYRLSENPNEFGILAFPHLPDARMLEVKLDHKCFILIRRPDSSECIAEAILIRHRFTYGLDAPIEAERYQPGWACSIKGLVKSDLPDGSEIFEIED